MNAGRAGRLAVALGLVWWWRRARPFRVVVEGRSMEPTLAAGDYLLATAAPRRVRSGSIVICEDPRRPGVDLVKRVLAGPGEAAPDGRPLGAHEYWVQGDRGGASTDSRAFGPVAGHAVHGVVRLRYWPPGRVGPPGRVTGGPARAP